VEPLAAVGPAAGVYLTIDPSWGLTVITTGLFDVTASGRTPTEANSEPIRVTSVMRLSHFWFLAVPRAMLSRRQE